MRAEARRLWLTGAGISDIATACDSTAAGVMNMMSTRRSEFPHRVAPIDGETAATIEAAWRMGLPLHNIASMTGRTMPALKMYVSRHRDACPPRRANQTETRAT